MKALGLALALVAALGAAVRAGAQAEPSARRPCVGTVVATDGRPANGVEVVFVHSGPGGPDLGATDRVTATTDARGRFIARLLPNHAYSAWAAGDGGTSIVAEGVAAGGNVELVLQPNPEFAPILLGITNPWQDRWPFAIEVARDAQNVVFAPLPADGVLRLPPPVRARVRDRNCNVLTEVVLPRPFDGIVRLVLPDRATVKFRVLDAAGEPVAGAVVRHSTAPSNHGLPFFQACGATDANGEFCGSVPMHATEPWPVFVGAPGHAECLFWPVPGTDGKKAIVDAAQVDQPADGFYVLRLRAPVTLHLHDGTVPLAQASEIVLTGVGMCAAEVRRATELTVDAAGDAAVPLPLGTESAMLRIRAKNGGAWHFLSLPPLTGGRIDVDLADQRAVKLQFLDEAGGPARGLIGMLAPDRAQDGVDKGIPFATDQAGRFACTLGPGSWQLFAADDGRFGTAAIPAIAGSGDDELAPTIRCEALLQAHLRLHDGDGKPMAGIAAHSVGVDKGVSRTQAFVSGCMRSHIERIAKARSSDRDGTIVLPFPKPDFPNSYTVQFFTVPYRSGTVRLETEDPSEVVLYKLGR